MDTNNISHISIIEQLKQKIYEKSNKVDMPRIVSDISKVKKNGLNLKFVKTEYFGDPCVYFWLVAIALEPVIMCNRNLEIAKFIDVNYLEANFGHGASVIPKEIKIHCLGLEKFEYLCKKYPN